MRLFAFLSRDRGVAHNVRFVAHVLRERKATERAAKRMPKPVPWDWAMPRLVPLLSGPSIDTPDLPIVRTTAGPGCAIEFGMDVGGAYLLVDARVAERWECRPEQLRDVALANLRRRTRQVSPASLSTGTFSGRIVRMWRGPRYAASLVLLEDELVRLFGSHDQVLATPSQSFLISFPVDTPGRVLADTVVDLEMGEALPLWFDPFLLHDGHLIWQPADLDGDDSDEERALWTS
jgi:hypothetical protein